MQVIQGGGWSDEFANLKSTGLPVCFVFGKNEKVVNLNYLNDYPGKWSEQVFYINNAGHFCNNDQPQVFNELLEKFATDCFK
jgi:pimeloyl-ACP methyl ester carboxylesterase